MSPSTILTVVLSVMLAGAALIGLLHPGKPIPCTLWLVDNDGAFPVASTRSYRGAKRRARRIEEHCGSGRYVVIRESWFSMAAFRRTDA